MKQKNVHICQNCGFESAKWLGKCPACAMWNSFAEETRLGNASGREWSDSYTLKSDKPLPLHEIDLKQNHRVPSGIGELDRVLGGGFVTGSLTLLGGDPGIGKSTLVLQMLASLATQDLTVLYVTGEESTRQIKMRAERLGVSSRVLVVAESSLENILNHAAKIKPHLLVVDSIQTVYIPHLGSAPGSVQQVRECTGKLLYFSKTSHTAAFLVGHVTKDGAIAGPRLLEHMVDTVLYFESDPTGQYRILRSIKNRYGSTNEMGVFEMTASGLSEIPNPSRLFLRHKKDHASGSCITATVEGTRPLVLELQALVSSSQLANPRRTTLGIDANRVSLIVAVLEKICGLNLYNQDIYMNAVGGIKLNEPAADLAVGLSLISSFHNKPLPPDLVAIGEIGLTGEIRPVSHIEKRIQEAVKNGFCTVMIPESAHLQNKSRDINILPCRDLNHAVKTFF